MSYINFNGEFFKKEQPVLTVANRAFTYGDALFESMRWHKQQILFLEDHFERLKEGMILLKMEFPKQFSIPFLQQQIFNLLKKNNITGDARIRLQVFRNEGGYYTPTDNSTSFVLTAEKTETDNYTFNEKGLLTEIFYDFKKNNGGLSNFKTVNSNIYSLAGIFAKESKADECFIVNHNNVITDAISTNVFIVKNNIVITSPITEGCVNGVMRKNVLRVLANENYRTEESPVREEDILSADELFLTNISRGIQWVEIFKEKIYSNTFSKTLFEKFLMVVG